MGAVENSTASLLEYWPDDSDWTGILQEHLASAEFGLLAKFLEAEAKQDRVFPPLADVFAAFRFCPAAETRVVILGQDPYHGEGQAQGLSFSVRAGNKLPPSLRNIFRELNDDLGIDRATDGDLTGWARQGVLMLNTVLTVRAGCAYSHRNQGWENFSDRVIQLLGQRLQPIVFLLWGGAAAKKKSLIGSQHLVLESAHPSPFSAHRGFFGSRPFSRTNVALNTFGQPPIDWSRSFQ